MAKLTNYFVSLNRPMRHIEWGLFHFMYQFLVRWQFDLRLKRNVRLSWKYIYIYI